jgi:hypothetical protein
MRVEEDKDAGHIIWVLPSGIRRIKAQPHMFMPFAEDALRKSVRQLVREDDQLTEVEWKSFEQFYADVQNGVARGTYSKCFTIPVGDVVEQNWKQLTESK